MRGYTGRSVKSEIQVQRKNYTAKNTNATDKKYTSKNTITIDNIQTLIDFEF